MSGVVHKHIVQSRALHESDVTRRRHPAADSSNATVVLGPSCDEMRKISPRISPPPRPETIFNVSVHSRARWKVDFQNVLAGNGRFQFTVSPTPRSFPWSTIAMRSHSLSASSMSWVVTGWSGRASFFRANQHLPDRHARNGVRGQWLAASRKENLWLMHQTTRNFRRRRMPPENIFTGFCAHFSRSTSFIIARYLHATVSHAGCRRASRK